MWKKSDRTLNIVDSELMPSSFQMVDKTNVGSIEPQIANSNEAAGDVKIGLPKIWISKSASMEQDLD